MYLAQYRMGIFMKGAKTIISKELKRVFQDKKLIFSLFILPAIMVIGIYALIGQLTTSMTKNIDEHISNVVIQNTPAGLKDFIKACGYEDTAQISYLDTKDTVEEVKQKVLDETVDLFVVFEKGFLENIAAYKKAGDKIPVVELYYNTTGNYSQAAKNNFEAMILTPLETSLLGERLGNLELLNVFETKQTVIADEDKANGQFLAMMLPYLITFLLFVGAMSLGVDSFTGEKERGTMASMLLAPIKRQEIVIGKLVSLSILSGISAAVYAAAMILSMPMMAKSMSNGVEMNVSLHFTFKQIIMLIIIMMCMVILYVALVGLVAIIAKTSKEANTYVSPIYIVVLLAGMITMFQGGMEKRWYQFAIPVYGNSLAIQNLMTNELTFLQFGLAVGSTLLLAIILMALLTKSFNSEKVMFNA